MRVEIAEPQAALEERGPILPIRSTEGPKGASAATSATTSAPSPAQRLRELRALLPATDGPLRAHEPIRRLCADIRISSRVEASLLSAPQQAGPLNSHGVVVRALQRLNATSPAYVRGLVAQMEAWGALEDLSGMRL